MFVLICGCTAFTLTNEVKSSKIKVRGSLIIVITTCVAIIFNFGCISYGYFKDITKIVKKTKLIEPKTDDSTPGGKTDLKHTMISGLVDPFLMVPSISIQRPSIRQTKSVFQNPNHSKPSSLMMTN
jgi:hypothetical protein